jgi:hypothetical protein
MFADARAVYRIEIASGYTDTIVSGWSTLDPNQPWTYSFSSPSGITYVGNDSTAVLADSGNNRLYSIDLISRKAVLLAGSDHVCTRWGPTGCEMKITFRDGPDPLFNMPSGLAYDARTNTLLVCDQNNHAIRRFNLSSGNATTIAGDGALCNGEGDCDSNSKGSYAEGRGTNARFNQPSSIALVPGTNYAVVTDSFNHRIRSVKYDMHAVCI